MRQRKAYTVEERRLMIVQALLIETGKEGQGATMTAAEIAHKLDVTPSTKLRIMLSDMAIDGMVVIVKEKHASIAGYRYLYYLPIASVGSVLKTAKDGAFGKHRQIRINSAQGSFWGELR